MLIEVMKKIFIYSGGFISLLLSLHIMRSLFRLFSWPIPHHLRSKNETPYLKKILGFLYLDFIYFEIKLRVFQAIILCIFLLLNIIDIVFSGCIYVARMCV